MRVCAIPGVPDYDAREFSSRTKDYCLLIPVINEGDRIRRELERARDEEIFKLCDIVICDGGSTDGSLDPDFLISKGVNTLITKLGVGKQGAQLRTGIHFALERGYEGILTVDGNDKDSIECVPLFIDALQQGNDFVQGSRFVEGGAAINTPLERYIALRAIHAPVTSLAAGHVFTDTTNAFRAYSSRLLRDSRIAPLRDVFCGYELLAYLPIRAARLGYGCCEVPVRRSYPSSGHTPTKISPLKGNMDLLWVLFKAAAGGYNPSRDEGSFRAEDDKLAEWEGGSL